VNMRKPDSREMALRGRIGAFRLHATHDPRDTTRSARKAFTDRFERLVDPDCSLPTRERQRRAEAARMAYYAQLAQLSATARRRRKGSPTSQHRASHGSPETS